jgi:hypothetical protein
MKWLKKVELRKVIKFVQPVLLGLKELLINILQPMQIWLQANIAKTLTTVKNKFLNIITMMKKPMLNAIQKVKMAMEKKPKMAMKKKPKMAMPKKPKFNPKLKQAAKSGKLDNNPKFKAAVMKGSKKPKMAMKKKPMMAMKKKK